MPARHIIMFILAGTLFSTEQHQIEPPADFGFVFEYGVCSTNTLDTFTGWFRRQPGEPGREPVTTQISLTGSQMRYIYQTIEEIGFFGYPSVYASLPLGFAATRTATGFPRYRLEVRSRAVFHSVQWEDRVHPTTSEADRLRRLFGWIVAFINSDRLVRRLPHAASDCE